MAVYEKLLLSSGGGIISEKQQAEQVRNTATLLIGLGGTGIDCLRTIKTQVYSRLKPDNFTATIPCYEHIRFLGVDSDESCAGSCGDGTLTLDIAEFFSIADKNNFEDLWDRKKLKQCREVGWLTRTMEYELSYCEPFGIRQIGRYLMMRKSEAFMEKVRGELMKAKTGLSGDTSVDVHIFSGLSGGTGSGIFLDVCYMIRSLANQIGGITIHGYFFLPDVNVAKVFDTQTKRYIPVNGYAAMQELDYCMRLPKNGGKFTQLYSENKVIEWNTPPVDMCHLVSGTTKDGTVLRDAYRYAMNVTAEYVMDFLTKSDNFGHDLKSQFSNFIAKFAQDYSCKFNGYNLAYCTIGGSCAEIPLREINTYLASELFGKFSAIEDKTPSENEVKEIFRRVLAPKSGSYEGCYEFLFREVTKGADNMFCEWQGDYKSLFGTDHRKIVEHYAHQRDAKMNVVESNCMGLQDIENNESLVGRLNSVLRECIQDINRGPFYAYKVISAAESHNFMNLVDRIIEENKKRLYYLVYTSKIVDGNLERARADFKNKKQRSLFDSDKKRFEEYEREMQIQIEHYLKINEHRKIDELLRKFRKQVVDLSASHYSVLAKVMGTLMETFRVNKATLASEEVMAGKGSFVESMMTIGELKESLDEEVSKCDVQNVMKTFMELLLHNENLWIDEDENKITQLVTNYFTNTIFSSFANKTITSFLKDKYQTHDNEQLAKEVYKDWIKPLTDKATPMFCFNSSIWSPRNLSEYGFISVPALSEPVKAAAVKMHEENLKWAVNESSLTDRICVMNSAFVFPMCAYNPCSKYEQDYFSAGDLAGRHYYEGVGLDMDFNDWRKLPSITPQSLIELEKAPAPLAKIIREGQELYERAEKHNVFGEYNEILRLNGDYKTEIEKTTDEAIKLASETSNLEQIAELKKMLQKLESYRDLNFERSDMCLEREAYMGDSEIYKRVREDYFVSSPAYWKRVYSIVSEIEETKKKVESAVNAVASKINFLKEGA